MLPLTDAPSLIPAGGFTILQKNFSKRVDIPIMTRYIRSIEGVRGTPPKEQNPSRVGTPPSATGAPGLKGNIGRQSHRKETCHRHLRATGNRDRQLPKRCHRAQRATGQPTTHNEVTSIRFQTLALAGLLTVSSFVVVAPEVKACGRLSRGGHCPLTKKTNGRASSGRRKVQLLQRRVDSLIDKVYSSSHPNRANIMNDLSWLEDRLAVWSYVSENDYRVLTNYDNKLDRLENMFHQWKVRNAKRDNSNVVDNNSGSAPRNGSIYSTPGNIIELPGM